MPNPQSLHALLARIATALEALSPAAPAPTAPAHSLWSVWSEGQLRPAPPPPVLPLTAFRGIDAQRDALAENIRRHANGLPAHDMLLWGARGMGKSALIRAAHAHQASAGPPVALVQVARTDVASLARLLDRLASAPPTTLFLDDLAFDGSTAEVHALRSLLDGGLESRPPTLRLAVTSNRRHLLPQPLSTPDPEDATPRDTRDDGLALADRFGLRLGFHPCDQPTYLAICESLASLYGLAFDPAAAIAFAAGRGSRSGRTAWHHIVEAAGQQGIRIQGQDPFIP
jgi:predicted AAA+ superfamily ATPase